MFPRHRQHHHCSNSRENSNASDDQTFSLEAGRTPARPNDGNNLYNTKWYVKQN